MPTRLHGAPRQCPIGGPGLTQCQRTVRAGHLMCGAHWRQVPRDVASEVWRTWRRFNQTSADDDWEAYAAARQAALDTFTPTRQESNEQRPW